MFQEKNFARTAAFAAVAAVVSGSAIAADVSKMKGVDVIENDATIVVRVAFDGAKPEYNKFSIQNPNREVIDFKNAENGSGKRTFGFDKDLSKGIQLVQADGRMRMVFANPSNMPFEIKTDDAGYVFEFTKHPGNSTAERFQNVDAGKRILNTEKEIQDIRNDRTYGSVFVKKEEPSNAAYAVKDYEFKRTVDGAGQLIVDLSDPKAPFDVKNKDGKVTISFKGASIPFNIEKKVRVMDYNTPVASIEAGKNANGAYIVLNQKGESGYEAVSYLNGNKLVVDIKTVKEELLGDAKRVYRGDKMGIDFQNIEVRAVLSTIAEFTGLNIITSDSVQGNVTLKLKSVPWDQVLDIVLDAKGLGMVRKGNVIWVAPKQEIADKERAESNLNEQRLEREPLLTESFQLSFQKADALRQLLVDKDQRILSKRGSVMIDTRTNMVFVNDVHQKLAEVKALIKKVDIPVRQVMIEARIVEASENFAKNIGARLGINSKQGVGLTGDNSQNLFNIGGSLQGNMSNTGQLTTTSATIADNMNVNLPAATINGFNPSAFSFILFNKSGTRFLNMELSALVSDGKGRIVSSPRVVTADQAEASIEQGTEIPYQQSTSAGATSVAFKKATLSLKVKPQITPDNRVVLDLNVTKDSVGATTVNGVAIDTKRINTQVLVENGGTVAIGGIIMQDETETVMKTPLLGDLPYVGMFFKNTSKSSNRKELIMLITPKVVQDLSQER